MATSRHPKIFDSVAFKRQIQAQISEEIRGLTPEEEIIYFRRAAETGPLGESWRAVKRTKAAAGGREVGTASGPTDAVDL